MTDHQRILLQVFEAVDAFCRQQNITYVMLGGTMLGAYRHKGFIPWDDDIDLGMPRADYERFLKVAGTGLPTPYVLRHFLTEKAVPYAFAHVEHTGTTYIEARRSGAGYRGGVYVEIFPLDAAPGRPFLQRRRELQVKLLKKRLYALIMEQRAGGTSLLKRAVIFLFRKTGTIDGIVRKLDRLLQQDAAKHPSAYGNLLGHWGRREIVPADAMFPAVEYSFENRTFFGVQAPEVYLASLYGVDYMTPPPAAERERGKHEAVYCNLEESYLKGSESEV